VKLAIAAPLVLYLVFSGKVDWSALAAAGSRPLWLVAALGLMAANLLFASMRFFALLRAQRIAIGPRAAVRLTLVGSFFDVLVPGGFGGDPVRIYYAAKLAPGCGVEGAAAVLADRALGFAALALLAGTAGGLAGGPALGAVIAGLRASLGPGATLGAALALVLAAGAGAFLLRARRAACPAAPSRLARAAGAAGALVRAPGAFAAALALSLLLHISTVGVFFAAGRALGAPPLPPRTLVAIVPLGLLANAVPGPPAGLGAGEWAFERLYALALGPGVRSPGAEVCLVWRAALVVVAQAGGLLYLLGKRGAPARNGVGAELEPGPG
jgi:hypothetical protein